MAEAVGQDEIGIPGPGPDRLRLTSIVGTLGCVLVVAGFFLPWVQVDRADALRYRTRLEQRLERRVQPVPANVPEADWLRLARLAAAQGHVTGLDIFYWARTAKATADAYAAVPASQPAAPSGPAPWEGPAPPVEGTDEESGGAGSNSPSGALPRAIQLVAVLLAALPVVALLLGLYFLLLFLRRAHSPALAVAVLDGAVAMGVIGAYGIVRDGLGVATSPAPGLTCTGAGGALLLLAGVFGVRVRNWYRVFLLAGLIAGTLYLVARHYVLGGEP